MRHVGFHKLDNFFRRMLLSMTLVLFSIHAVLPAGFMPDFSTLRDGEFKIVVCTGLGYQTVIVDQEGNPVNPADHHDLAKAPQCEFNTPGSKVFVQQAPTLTTEITFLTSASDFYTREFGLNHAIQGAPVGLRAPPTILV